MNQSKFILLAILTVSIVLVGASVSHGQLDSKQQVEQSYDVSLQILIGSNDAAQAVEVPAGLSALSKQLKGSFGFSKFRLASTLFGRISNTGSLEYKSLTNIFGKETNTTPQTFMEWSIGNFRNMPTAKGVQGFQAQSFRFGARVPVPTSMAKDESGKMASVVNYESIGLSLGKVGLPENSPTLIGTLNLPGADGSIFLIVTVKSSDM